MKRWQAAGLLSTLLAGCNSTGVGNPAPALTLSLIADDEPEPADDGAAGAANGGDDGLARGSVRHAVLVLGELLWLPCDRTLEPVRVVGPFVVDLATNRTEPAIPAVEPPESGFCGLDAPLAPALAPAALAGRSIFFDGDRADGTRFLLYANMQATLRLRRRGTATWDGSEWHAALWALRPRRWVGAVELAALDSVPWDGARAVVINVERHPLLYAAIRGRLAGRSTLYADLDSNGRLDPDERAESARVGDGTDQAD